MSEPCPQDRANDMELGATMRKVFKVELDGHNGVYTKLTLPATPCVMLDALEKLWLAEGEAPGWEILQADAFPGVSMYLDQKGTLSELNALAQRFAALDEQELAIVEGLAIMEREQSEKSRIPLPRLIDLASSTDCCHLVEGVVTDAQLGRFCAENGFVPEADDLSDAAFALLDFARIGKQFRQEEGGVFTRVGYVQRHDELKQVYQTLDITIKKPDYAILGELPDGSRVKLPTPLGKTVVEEPARCVDCTAPALNGLTAMRSTLDMLARRLAELEVDGELPKYKAVLEATHCDDICRALSLADELDQYTFDPDLLEPDEVGSGHLKGLLPEEELAALLSNVNLYRYGQALMEQRAGKLTAYGLVERADGHPVQGMDQEQTRAEGMSLV